ncbi:MAG: c-type cytochrome [Phaeodactylibacter sp.]|nr:c-type cytochrome [Phaeodactylibacter sp.]MCB9273175.1 c-type cytochrome [Lewinellaceae bacterium]
MKNKLFKILFAALPLLLAAMAAGAQDAAAGGEAASDPYFYSRLFSNSLVIVAGVVLLGAIFALVHLLNVMVKVQQIRIYQEQGMDAYLEEVKKSKESFWQRIYKQWTKVVPVEKEQDILFDHEYDGIRELDNSLPPWWVAMFYITIGFGIIYYTYYHFSGAGPSSKEEYQMEMEHADKAVQAYLATQSNLVDETNVEALTDEASLAAGKDIFITNCAACHGTLGEGGVGPNMTDQYWIHGGDIKDIFKTIKYGVPEKGMISWKSQLSASEMNKVASYLLTLQGTNPPNAKEPQGDLYQQQVDKGATTPPSDSTSTEQQQTESESGAIGMNQ